MWSIDEVMKLIEEYEKHPILYDTKSPNYSNKVLRLQAIKSIKSELQFLRPGTKEIEVQKKLNSIRNNYVIEKLKVVESKKTATGPQEVSILAINMYRRDVRREHVKKKQTKIGYFLIFFLTFGDE